MDVPNQAESQELSGAELISTLVTLTGLPESWVRTELDGILAQAGCARESLTMDELRVVLAGFLDSMQDDLAEEPPVALQVISSAD
jgi:hypothetical protein